MLRWTTLVAVLGLSVVPASAFAGGLLEHARDAGYLGCHLANGDTWVAKPFRVTSAGLATGAQVELAHITGSLGAVIVELWTEDAGAPGALLAAGSGTRSNSVSPELVAVTFPKPITLLDTVGNWAVVRTDGGDVCWSIAFSADEGAKRSPDAGGVWEPLPNTLTLNVAGMPGVIIRATDDPDYVVDEDQLLSVGPSAGVLANDGLGTVVFASVVGAAPGVVLWSGGDFTFTPPPDAFGIFGFDYRYEDPNLGYSHPARATITVKPVNDPPSFLLRSRTPQAPADGLVHTIPNVLSDLDAGPGEFSASFRFDVIPAAPSLFMTAPAIDSQGTLTFTPKTTPGVTALTIVMYDDEDAGFSQQLTLTLTDAGGAGGGAGGGTAGGGTAGGGTAGGGTAGGGTAGGSSAGGASGGTAGGGEAPRMTSLYGCAAIPGPSLLLLLVVLLLRRRA